MSEQLSWPRLKALLRNDSIGEYRNWLDRVGGGRGRAADRRADVAVNGDEVE